MPAKKGLRKNKGQKWKARKRIPQLNAARKRGRRKNRLG